MNRADARCLMCTSCCQRTGRAMRSSVTFRPTCRGSTWFLGTMSLMGRRCTRPERLGQRCHHLSDARTRGGYDAISVHSAAAITQHEADKQGQGATAQRRKQHRKSAPEIGVSYHALASAGEQELPREGVTKTQAAHRFLRSPRAIFFNCRSSYGAAAYRLAHRAPSVAVARSVGRQWRARLAAKSS